MRRILWICGRLPTPLFTGDALYSAGVLKALALTGQATITLVGTRRTEDPVGDHIVSLPHTICVDTPPARPSGLRSLLSPLPRDAFNLSTPELETALMRLLQKDWDWIVIDHAYSSGSISTILQHRKRASLCYVGHNAEGAIRPKIARSFHNPLRQAVMRVDAKKYCRLENRLLEAADAVICITEADKSYFRQFSANVYVVPPIYLGSESPACEISSERPRSLLLLGAFEWVAKQKNLQLIIDSLLPALQARDVSLNVVGAVPKTLQERYNHYRPHLVFHGRVNDVSPFFASARAGLVPELLGGGFKLKLLDYAFHRLPVFGLRNAMAGTTEQEQSSMFLSDNLNGLTEMILTGIDNLADLNQKQSELFDLFSARFGLEAGSNHLARILL